MDIKVKGEPLFAGLQGIFSTDLLELPTEILEQIISGFGMQPKLQRVFVEFQSYIHWVYIHSVHVAMISLMIAIRNGYHGSELCDIGTGALLHDIGKLMIPKPILEKEGALNADEMANMMWHCLFGQHLTKDCGLSEISAMIILQHHERLDGNGYPFHTKGKQIRREAQIAMIADIFDAITSDRPYRPSGNADEAMMELKNNDYFPGYFVNILDELLIHSSKSKE